MGDWSGLVDQFGYSENLMRRIVSGDLRYLLSRPKPRVEQRETPLREPDRTHPLRGFALRGAAYRSFVTYNEARSFAR